MVGRGPAAPSQNVGNVLGPRPCVRQTQNYRKYESGNSMKAIMGHDQLMWDVDRRQGVGRRQGVLGAPPEADEGPWAAERERSTGGFRTPSAAPGAHGHRPGPRAASQTPATITMHDYDDDYDGYDAGPFHRQAMEVPFQDPPRPPGLRLGPDQTHSPSVGRRHLLDGQWAAAAAARRRNIRSAEQWTGPPMTSRTLQVDSFRAPPRPWELGDREGPSVGQRTFFEESW